MEGALCGVLYSSPLIWVNSFKDSVFGLKLDNQMEHNLTFHAQWWNSICMIECDFSLLTFRYYVNMSWSAWFLLLKEERLGVIIRKSFSCGTDQNRVPIITPWRCFPRFFFCFCGICKQFEGSIGTFWQKSLLYSYLSYSKTKMQNGYYDKRSINQPFRLQLVTSKCQQMSPLVKKFYF